LLGGKRHQLHRGRLIKKMGGVLRRSKWYEKEEKRGSESQRKRGNRRKNFGGEKRKEGKKRACQQVGIFGNEERRGGGTLNLHNVRPVDVKKEKSRLPLLARGESRKKSPVLWGGGREGKPIPKTSSIWGGVEKGKTLHCEGSLLSWGKE